MKENKGKDVAGDEVKEEAIDQSRPPALSTVKLIPLASSERRKTVSKRLDMGNLPSRRGNKKQKVDPLTMSIPYVVVLDYIALVAKSRADTSPTHLDANPSKPSAVGPPNSD